MKKTKLLSKEGGKWVAIFQSRSLDSSKLSKGDVSLLFSSPHSSRSINISKRLSTFLSSSPCLFFCHPSTTEAVSIKFHYNPCFRDFKIRFHKYPSFLRLDCFLSRDEDSIQIHISKVGTWLGGVCCIGVTSCSFEAGLKVHQPKVH